MFVVKTVSILADNAGTRRIPRQRSGKFLDEARLGLVPAGETRVFARAQKKQFHDYRVSLLVDVSGSMSGSKLTIAAKCTHALEYALVRAGSKVDTYLFNGDFQKLKPEVTRDNTKLYQAAREQLDRWGGINNDADAVRLVTKDLIAQHEPGKILLVLSDGQPAPGGAECPIVKMISKVRGSSGKGKREDDSEEDLRNAVAEARNVGIVCLAVGIETSDPVKYYGKHHTAVVNDLKNLYSSMAKLLEQNIQRG